MKKLLILVFLFLSVAGMAQSIVEGDSLNIYGGGVVDGTLEIHDPVNDQDAATKIWVLSQGGVTAVDSQSWDVVNKYLFLYKGGVPFDTTEITGFVVPSDLDDYVAETDSNVVYATPYYVDSSIAASAQNVYEVELPVGSPLANSVSLAIGGVDFPVGWTLTASGNDLIITHNLGRYLANVTVQYNRAGTIYKHLYNYSQAYNTWECDPNSCTIISLTQFFTQYRLKIELIFK